MIQHYSSMTDRLRLPELSVPAVSRQPALILRPWSAADIPALTAEMSRDYLMGGMWSAPDERPFRTVLRGGVERIGPAEIGYWTAVKARGRGIAPAAVRAVTEWAFDVFAGASLRQIMLVHDVADRASCRVAEKAGYPFRQRSPANPPVWFTDGHIHAVRGTGR